MRMARRVFVEEQSNDIYIYICRKREREREREREIWTFSSHLCACGRQTVQVSHTLLSKDSSRDETAPDFDKRLMYGMEIQGFNLKVKKALK